MKKSNLFLSAIVAGSLMVSCGSKTTETAADSTQVAVATEEVVAAPAAPAFEDGQYNIPAGGTVKWVGKKVTGQHNGTVGISAGSLTVTGGKLTAGTVAIDMKALICEDEKDAKTNKKLIGHLSSDDFFSIAKFPTANLVIKEVTGEAGSMIAKGDLTIKGITKPVEIPVSVMAEGGSLKATATFTIDRTLWEIKYNSGKFMENLGDKMINDEIELSFDVTAAKAS